MLLERLNRNFTICPIPVTLGTDIGSGIWSVEDDLVLRERDYQSRNAYIALYEEANVVKNIILATYDYQRNHFKRTGKLLDFSWFKNLLSTDKEMTYHTQNNLKRMFQEQLLSMQNSIAAKENFSWKFWGMDVFNCKIRTNSVGQETFSIGTSTFLISSDINIGQISRKNVRLANCKINPVLTIDYRIKGKLGETKTIVVDTDFEFYDSPEFYEDAVKQSHYYDVIVAQTGGCHFPFRM